MNKIYLFDDSDLKKRPRLNGKEVLLQLFGPLGQQPEAHPQQLFGALGRLPGARNVEFLPEFENGWAVLRSEPELHGVGSEARMVYSSIVVLPSKKVSGSSAAYVLGEHARQDDRSDLGSYGYTVALVPVPPGLGKDKVSDPFFFNHVQDYLNRTNDKYPLSSSVLCAPRAFAGLFFPETRLSQAFLGYAHRELAEGTPSDERHGTRADQIYHAALPQVLAAQLHSFIDVAAR